ncbi:MAG: 50S ribosomal protein L24 [Candidatus Cloacimonetes bacterium]|nr:50S ribosomal protein L24 [Candidatus Cloacimonadota bacterium]MCF7814349.1 50S ribosomal protein L24 [Candidatus Cloacimonadota bacterium]MCF7868959.1 50S ribosomal protein L24 [Candidatus Cloacimonadota bacterium]MCF7884353.1 50S ribosomal protein L24 [Candidatus Cloacimonadota bacterium]
MRIKKGDTVVVLSGQYRGVKGKVLKAFPSTDKVIVEKVNFIKKHTRPTQQNPQGGIIEREGPIHVSNVKLYNEKIGDVTNAVFKTVGQNRVRSCKKTGDEI